ncbi:hypothetical protein BDV93DRAFT_548315 [Ceratobasidium sp. AG-I]|nr:hypothetical protein BDV93DRAFT_548315 [Ceratobasidium sp. AG-I]
MVLQAMSRCSDRAFIAAIAIATAPSIAAITLATDVAQDIRRANKPIARETEHEEASAGLQSTVEEEEEQDDSGDNNKPVRRVTIKINTAKDKTSSNAAPTTKPSSAATTSGTAKKAASSSHAALLSKVATLSKNSVPAAPVAPVAALTSKKRPLEDKDEGPEPEPTRNRLRPRMKGAPKDDDTPGEAQSPVFVL